MSSVSSLTVKSEVDLSAFNTFGIRSQAQHYVKLEHIEQLPALAELLTQYPDYIVLGGGSNVILAEQVQRLVIHNAIKGIRLLAQDDQTYMLEAGAGESWHAFVKYCVQQGYGGLENLALIPGTVGAAPVQNIGAYGREFKDFCHQVIAYDLQQRQLRHLSPAECQFGYRDSYFKHEGKSLLIVAVQFALAKSWRACLQYPDLQKHPLLAQKDPEQVRAQDVFQAVCEIRQHKLPDPAVHGNAGSFFKNPIVNAKVRARLLEHYPQLPNYLQANGDYKLAAAWLIDQAGWKGRVLNSVRVHDRQALVLVNNGGATFAEVQEVAQAIMADVQAKFAVDLVPEPSFIQ
ncbi:UDP-N-acetylmuramate dehydrogenase [Brackiella oedipodis]|uniref:UDP-N-acetylmuramate dehydrogenase n=1 Tax=Brackiella oedipodis TaxID=124225 RepID=UPI000685600A|nr:UDP-N-acetylmuramate dehydrogenase [Brackiella oedipodis]